MKTTTIRQSVSFKAKPKDVFELIMDSRKHAKFAGGPVKMSRKPGGKFSVFDGYAQGTNIDIVEGKKIVQNWHFAEEGWPADHFSVCTFTFAKSPTGTKLNFVQTGVPVGNKDSLKQGWKDYYWNPMKELLAASK